MSQRIIDAVPFEHYTLIEDKAQISESFKDEVNNSRGAILAIVKGKHFCPDGTSRNHRFYPKALWLGVKNDENFMARLKRNGVVGRVGTHNLRNKKQILKTLNNNKHNKTTQQHPPKTLPRLCALQQC